MAVAEDLPRLPHQCPFGFGSTSLVGGEYHLQNTKLIDCGGAQVSVTGNFGFMGQFLMSFQGCHINALVVLTLPARWAENHINALLVLALPASWVENVTFK